MKRKKSSCWGCSNRLRPHFSLRSISVVSKLHYDKDVRLIHERQLLCSGWSWREEASAQIQKNRMMTLLLSSFWRSPCWLTQLLLDSFPADFCCCVWRRNWIACDQLLNTRWRLCQLSSLGFSSWKWRVNQCPKASKTEARNIRSFARCLLCRLDNVSVLFAFFYKISP